jgi:hypothetical protein
MLLNQVLRGDQRNEAKHSPNENGMDRDEDATPDVNAYALDAWAFVAR